MKAITLTQPWASLVVCGEKRVETRGWDTRHRGPLAIHAAKSWTRDDEKLCLEGPFWRALSRHNVNAASLPFGAIVGVVELVKTAPITDELTKKLSVQEQAFGGYAPGRFAFALRGARRLRAPIPMRGQLSIFELAPEIADALERGLRGEAGLGEIVCTHCGGALDGGHMVEECTGETHAEMAARHVRERAAEAAIEDFEERAAIREFDGGLPRAEAEARAREDASSTAAGRDRSPGDRRDASPTPKEGDPGECRSCGAAIVWTLTAAGKRAPWDLDGTSHFATCPNAAHHRKPKAGAKA